MPTATVVLNVTTPPLRVPVPIEFPPSRKVTVPVGVPTPGANADTVAVNVTDWPNTDGFTEEVTVVVVSALITEMLAFAVVLVPPVDDEAETLLFVVPTAVPLTFTVTAHDEPGVRFAPDKLTLEDPFTAVAVPLLQVVLTLLGVATFNPACSVSLNATPFNVRF